MHLNFKSHKITFRIGLLLVLFILVCEYLNYLSLQSRIETHSLKTFERQSLTLIERFHERSMALTSDFFKTNLSAVENLAKDPGLVAALQLRDKDKIQEILDRQRTVNGRFLSIGALDKNGNFTYVSSANSASNNFLGTNFSYRDYFSKVVSNRESYIDIVPQTVSGNHVIVFASPVLDEQGKTFFVLTGTLTLPDLDDKLRLYVRLSTLKLTLVEDGGTILLENDKAPDNVVAISDKDPVFSRFLASHERIIEDEEVNYLGEKTFARAGAVSLPQGKRLILLAYYPKKQFENEIAGINNEIKRIFIGSIMRDLLLLCVVFGAIAWFIQKHNAAAHHCHDETADHS